MRSYKGCKIQFIVLKFDFKVAYSSYKNETELVNFKSGFYLNPMLNNSNWPTTGVAATLPYIVLIVFLLLHIISYFAKLIK